MLGKREGKRDFKKWNLNFNVKMVQIEDEILDVLRNLNVDGNSVRITQQLDRKLYLDVNKVLERIGGKWNRKAKAHVFDNDPIQRLRSVIETGTVNPKVKTGYFNTPREVITKMIGLADLHLDQRILEPSAGQGHIADMIVDYLSNGNMEDVNISLCETLPENTTILKEKGYYPEGNFFEFAEHCKENKIYFDRILMNPPFEKQADIDHVTTAYNLLADNGILVAIMSSGVTFRENKKTIQFRENVLNYQTHIEEFPPRTFEKTNVKSVLVRIENRIQYTKPILTRSYGKHRDYWME